MRAEHDGGAPRRRPKIIHEADSASLEGVDDVVDDLVEGVNRFAEQRDCTVRRSDRHRPRRRSLEAG